MTKQHINTGTAANAKNGDPLRTAFDKVNANFDELYAAGNPIQYHLGDDTQFVDIDPDTGMVVIQSGFDTGMPVYIKGANCSDEGVGGNVIIEAGGAPLPNNGTTGNIELAAQQTTIESNNNMWSFRDDGVLELPEGGDIVDSNGDTVLGTGTADTGSWTFDTVTATTNGNIIVKAGSGADAWASLLSNNGANSFWVDDVGAHVTSNFIEGETTENYWTFGDDGTLTLPGDETITDTKVTNWDTAYEWGDHSIAGYVTGTPWTEAGYVTGTPWTEAGYVTGTPWTEAGYLTAEADTLDSVTTRGNTTTNDITVGDLTVSGEIKSAAGTGDVVVEANDGTARTWTFGGDGTLTLPAGGDIKNGAGTSVLGATLTLQSKPTTKEGQAGDLKGMIAIDSIGGEFYYCIADYTDGADPIWAKVAGSTSWI